MKKIGFDLKKGDFFFVAFEKDILYFELFFNNFEKSVFCFENIFHVGYQTSSFISYTTMLKMMMSLFVNGF
jgi:hypothetical protein